MGRHSRNDLLSLLGVEKLYDLDRMDLSVRTPLDLPTQITLSEEILKLKNPQWLTKIGLTGFRLLDKGDPGKVIYSLVLYDSTEKGNLLRLQIDNYEHALNINEGVKLDLGSTAKLRTLIHYLEIIESLYQKYSSVSPQVLGALRVHEDTLTKWAITYLSETRDRDLKAMLAASLERTYSASPRENFFTGGGVHAFENFDEKDNNRILTLREGFTHSVNLVFIRLMRDIVQHHIGMIPPLARCCDPRIIQCEKNMLLGLLTWRGKSSWRSSTPSTKGNPLRKHSSSCFNPCSRSPTGRPSRAPG